MKISVIIPTYNEENVIGECLESLSKQKSVDFEIIVVDDGSTDKTLEVLHNFQLKRAASQAKTNFQILRQPHLGPAMARNLGAKNAKGEILVFVDSDMTFDGNFLKMLTKPIVAGKLKGTWSILEFVSNWQNRWARYWSINQGWMKKRRHKKNSSKQQKVFRAVLKKEFDRVGGFSKGGYTDDYTLCQKLGYEATLAPHAIFYHKNPDNLGEILIAAIWSAKRKYKFGIVGIGVALTRSSLPISAIVGLYKSITILDFRFLIFKLVYDLGVFIGILQMVLKGKLAK